MPPGIASGIRGKRKSAAPIYQQEPSDAPAAAPEPPMDVERPKPESPYGPRPGDERFGGLSDLVNDPKMQDLLAKHAKRGPMSLFRKLPRGRAIPLGNQDIDEVGEVK
jgi:hypothetical protein